MRKYSPFFYGKEMEYTVSFHDRFLNFFYLIWKSTVGSFPPLDERVNNCMVDLNLSPKCPAYVKKDIKARLIKEYCSLTPPKEGPVEPHIEAAYQNTLRKATLQLLPSTPIQLTEEANWQKSIQDYKKTSAYKEASLSKFLESTHFLALATKIDQNMKSPLTLKKIAGLITIEYRNDLQKAIYEITKKEVGADDLATGCLAILLLQKETKFKNALEQLEAYIRSNDACNHVIASINHYKQAIHAITQGEKDP